MLYESPLSHGWGAREMSKPALCDLLTGMGFLVHYGGGLGKWGMGQDGENSPRFYSRKRILGGSELPETTHTLLLWPLTVETPVAKSRADFQIIQCQNGGRSRGPEGGTHVGKRRASLRTRYHVIYSARADIAAQPLCGQAAVAQGSIPASQLLLLQPMLGLLLGQESQQSGPGD